MNLMKDIPYYISIIEVMHRHSAQVLFEHEHALCIYDEPSHMHMLACDDEYKDYEELIQYMKDDSLFLIHGEGLHDYILETYHKKPNMVAFNSLYDHMEPIPLPESEVKIRPLDESHIPDVLKHYSIADLCEETHIRSRIQEGMLGAFVNGKLCGFIGTHEEGSIGMLEVYPQYRRQGIARLLQCAMVNQRLKENHYAFGQVLDYNHASMELQKSLGFVISDMPCYWYFGLHE